MSAPTLTETKQIALKAGTADEVVVPMSESEVRELFADVESGKRPWSAILDAGEMGLDWKPMLDAFERGELSWKRFEESEGIPVNFTFDLMAQLDARKIERHGRASSTAPPPTRRSDSPQKSRRRATSKASSASTPRASTQEAAQPEIVVEDPKRDGTADEVVVGSDLSKPVTLTPHPLALLFPEMDAEQFKALREDINKNGVRQPILVHEGMILDGWHRYKATKVLMIECPTIEWAGDEKEILPLVISLNLKRRHLDASQRSLVAKRIANLAHGGDRRSDQAASLPVVTQAEAAAMMNVSERSVRTAREVLEHGVPELVSAVERGEVSVSAAAAVAKLEPDEQRQLAARPKEITAKAKAIRCKRAKLRERKAPTQEPAPTTLREIVLNVAGLMKEIDYIKTKVSHAVESGEFGDPKELRKAPYTHGAIKRGEPGEELARLEYLLKQVSFGYVYDLLATACGLPTRKQA